MTTTKYKLEGESEMETLGSRKIGESETLWSWKVGEFETLCR